MHAGLCMAAEMDAFLASYNLFLRACTTSSTLVTPVWCTKS